MSFNSGHNNEANGTDVHGKVGQEGNNNNDPELIGAGAGAGAWTQLDRRNCLIWMDNRF